MSAPGTYGACGWREPKAQARSKPSACDLRLSPKVLELVPQGLQLSVMGCVSVVVLVGICMFLRGFLLVLPGIFVFCGFYCGLTFSKGYGG